MLPGERFERGDDCFAVESRLDRGTVEIGLVRYRRRRTGLLHHKWVRMETIAAERFNPRDLTAYWRYASHLEEAARHALDGEFGCYVTIDRPRGGSVRIRLIERRLAGGELVTTILENEVFDASDPAALVTSAERAEELRERARRLNEEADVVAADAAAADAAAFADITERRRDAAELADILTEAADD